MSLWCPYIKANYCFLWSCNKYVLRHPVAKGADCFQERTQNHVFAGDWEGAQAAPRVPPSSTPATKASAPAARRTGRAGSVSPEPVTQIRWWWETSKVISAPGQSLSCGATAPSGLSTPMASIQQVAEQ